MYIVPIAWLYVAVMMAVAEATNTTGTVLGGVITFVLYGLLPVVLVVYVMGAPARKRAIKAKEKAEWLAAQNETRSTLKPDAAAQAPTDPVTPVREKP
ncbi:hypothetical protein [Rhodoferax sp.]|uniref:hypothetical protein n=1 Tax=Rhodoferax sp. TaxID=50421 RepID=UPI002624D2A4|nr:hypothetical protein [Rhodoferax sp.]MDD5478770.1 hypothetical protein [Rhodoferax sp.]